MSATRAVNMSFVALGLLTWIVMGSFWGWLISWFGPTADVGLIGVGFRLSDFLGLATGVIGTYMLWKNPKINDNSLAIANELKKVVWPSWQETRVSTFVVIVVTTIIALILGAYDAVWSFLTKAIYGI